MWRYVFYSSTGYPMYDGFDDSSTFMSKEIALAFADHYDKPVCLSDFKSVYPSVCLFFFFCLSAYLLFFCFESPSFCLSKIFLSPLPSTSLFLCNPSCLFLLFVYLLSLSISAYLPTSMFAHLSTCLFRSSDVRTNITSCAFYCLRNLPFSSSVSRDLSALL